MAKTRKVVLSIFFMSVVIVVKAAVSEQLLRVPLFEVGGLWIKAIKDVLTNVTQCITNPSEINFESPYLYIVCFILACSIYVLYTLFFVPLNRVRLADEVGYATEGGRRMKDVANAVMRRRKVGDIPPMYPNGWFAILESRDLDVEQAKSVSILGKTFAVFRDSKGVTHILDAHCPHLGADLAIGGRVFGNCIECPFHGWKFRGDDGKCVHIPYLEKGDKIPAKAEVKSWPVVEMNGFIYMWFHAENSEPTWIPEEIEKITKGEWTYRGRTEHSINAHIEEVPENGADPAHLSVVHSPMTLSGSDIRYIYSKVWEFARHVWSGEWEQLDQKHVGQITLTHSMTLFGMRLPFLDVNVKAKQIGPGIVHLQFDCLFGRAMLIMGLTPVEPLRLRMIHHIYGSRWIFPTIAAKLILHAEAIQVERDIMIWNNKQYQNKPVLVRSKEDQMISKHRRWYSQFYSENSPRLTLQKDTLEW